MNTEYNEMDKPNFWERNKSIIIKLVVIIICILILIFLISKITKKSTSIETMNKNLQAMQLSAEKYYFIDGKILTSPLTMTLSEMEQKNLVNNICTDNGKKCDGNNSKVEITKNEKNYELKITLTCGKSSKTLIRNYNKNDFTCINCNGKTYMKNIDNNKEENENKKDNNENKETTFNGEIDNNLKNEDITCSWSKWTENKLTGDFETETIKVVTIKKIGEKDSIEYTDFSEWTSLKIEPNETREVETKKEIKEGYSNEFKSNTKLNNSNNILIREETSKKTTSTCKYTKVNGKCVRTVTKDLTYKEFTNLNLQTKNCKGVYNKLENNKITPMYKSCTYQQNMGFTTKTTTSTVYVYKTKIQEEVTYYRYRNIIKNNIEKIENILKDNIPDGYEIVENSEKELNRYLKKYCIK